MSPYTPQDAFTAPELYDLSDLVKGSDTGDANVPLKALADQTNYLKNRMRRYEGVKIFTGDHAFDTTDLGYLLLFQLTGNNTFTLPDVGSLLPGTRIAVKTSIASIHALTVQSQEQQNIFDGSYQFFKWDVLADPAVYMHDGELLILVAGEGYWIVERADGNFYTAGLSVGSRRILKNTFLSDGTIKNRADVPRIALFAASLSATEGIVPDVTWGSDPGSIPVYRGLYSYGDGQNTIRIPDERGLSDKHLDMGRGIDISRLYNAPGGYEDEQVGKHDHATHGKGFIVGGALKWFLSITGNRYSAGGGTDSLGGQQNTPDLNMRTSDNAGTQNVVKNIGKIPLIYY
jgi:hypothetical protein